MATHRQLPADRLGPHNGDDPSDGVGEILARADAPGQRWSGVGVEPGDDAMAVTERRETWRGAYRPASAEDEWLFEQAVVNSVRVDRCQRDERVVRTHLAARARLAWGDDRRLAAEDLGARLSKNPAAVAPKLRKTRQGGEWLLDRWRALSAVLERGGEWTGPQVSLAMDLLGTPVEFRDPPPWSDSDPGSDPPSAVALREIATLERLHAGALSDLDEIERDAAVQGVDVGFSLPLPLSRLRRYEAECMRRFQWARERLKPTRLVSQEPAPARPSATPASRVPEPPTMTDDDWRAYEREIFANARARLRARDAHEPTPAGVESEAGADSVEVEVVTPPPVAPTPAPDRVRLATVVSSAIPPRLNRRQRRAAGRRRGAAGESRFP